MKVFVAFSVRVLWPFLYIDGHKKQVSIQTSFTHYILSENIHERQCSLVSVLRIVCTSTEQVNDFCFSNAKSHVINAFSLFHDLGET